MTRVLITGCSTGVGRATAVELTRRGVEVVATSRRLASLDDLDVAMRLRLDVDDDVSVREAVDAAGEVDVLVNNAAIGVHGPVETVPIEAFRAAFETNLLGAIRMVQALVPGMRERGSGRIVNVSSGAGRFSGHLNGPYAATKFALEAVSESMRFELAHFGIDVVVVEPGYIDTAWHQNHRWLGVSAPPYDELYRQIDELDREGQKTAPPAEDVALVIAEAIEAPEPRLRWPSGEGLQRALAKRAELSDEEWEAYVVDGLDLDW